MGPRRLRIDEVGRHRRNAAPVVDAGIDRLVEKVRRKVRRRLQIDGAAEHDAGNRERPQEIVVAGVARLRHAGAGLGAERLDDQFLNVAVGGVKRAQRQQCLDALAPRFADADQEARREWDRQLARRRDGGEPHRGRLVGRAEMNAAACRQPLRGTLQHEPHGGRNRPQHRQVVAAHDAGIEVWQEAGFPQHQGGRRPHVIERRGMAERRERRARRRVTEFRLVAEREQRFGAAGGGAGAGNAENLFGRHIGRCAAARRLREGAVVATVAAEMRERNEHLARIGHDGAVAGIAHQRRLAHQRAGVAHRCKRERLCGGNRGLVEILAHAVIVPGFRPRWNPAICCRWRKRVGVEPTKDRLAALPGFEVRTPHQGRFPSSVELGPLSCKLRQDRNRLIDMRSLTVRLPEPLIADIEGGVARA